MDGTEIPPADLEAVGQLKGVLRRPAPRTGTRNRLGVPILHWGGAGALRPGDRQHGFGGEGAPYWFVRLTENRAFWSARETGKYSRTLFVAPRMTSPLCAAIEQGLAQGDPPGHRNPGRQAFHGFYCHVLGLANNLRLVERHAPGQETKPGSASSTPSGRSQRTARLSPPPPSFIRAST